MYFFLLTMAPPLRTTSSMDELTQRDQAKVRAFQKQYYWKIDQVGECWLWKDRKRARSFFVHVAGIKYAPAQFAWAFTRGEWLIPITLTNNCGNSACVRPDHFIDGRAGLPDKRKGKVYFIQCEGGGPIKIGFTTKDVYGRMSQIQQYAPYGLVLIGWKSGFMEDEQALHRQFEKDRLRKRHEWFHPSGDLLSYLEGEGFTPQRPAEEKIA
jgi:hypothetical protein